MDTIMKLSSQQLSREEAVRAYDMVVSKKHENFATIAADKAASQMIKDLRERLKKK